MNSGPAGLLHVIPGGSVGGITTGLGGLLPHLDARRFKSTVAVLQPGPAAGWLRKSGLEVVAVPAADRPEFLRRLIRERRIRLVQSCDGAAAGAQAAALSSLPHLWFIGGRLEATFGGIPRNGLASIRTMIEGLSRRVIVPSRALACSEFPRLAGEKLAVIPWGIDLLPSRLGRSRIRKRLGIPAGSPVVAMVGNLYPAKRHFDFLRAASVILQARPDTRFVIAGGRLKGSALASRLSRKYAAELGRSIRKMGLDRNIHRMQLKLGDRAQFFGEIDLLLVPSEEGLAQAALEAGACGVPVIAADAGGMPEVIIDGRTGLLVPYRKPDTLARAALRVLRDPALAKRLGKSLRAHILSNLNSAKQAKRFERLYEKLLSGK